MVKKNYDNMLSRFHPVPERYGQTDGQTDRFAISISHGSMLTLDSKKLSCRREAARCFVFVCSQLQNTYSAVFYYQLLRLQIY